MLPHRARSKLGELGYPQLPMHRLTRADLADTSAWALGLAQWAQSLGMDVASARFVAKPAVGSGGVDILPAKGVAEAAAYACVLLQEDESLQDVVVEPYMGSKLHFSCAVVEGPGRCLAMSGTGWCGRSVACSILSKCGMSSSAGLCGVAGVRTDGLWQHVYNLRNLLDFYNICCFD